MIRVAFIVNSKRSLSKQAKQAIALVKRSELFSVEEFHTKRPGHAALLALEATKRNDVIVAVGGDGTCNEVLEGLLEADQAAIRMGIIPVGTGNDFMRMLPDFHPERFVDNLRNGTTQAIDIGEIEFKGGVSHFINIADVGFGAKVVQLMNKQRKRGLGGKLSYSTAILRAFASFKKPNMTISCKEGSHSGKTLMAIFCNGNTFAHGLVIHPGAELNSAKLGVTVIGNVTLLEYIKQLGRLKKGVRIEHPEVHYWETDEIEIQLNGKDVWVEGDGELLGANPIRVRVLPAQIQLVTCSES